MIATNDRSTVESEIQCSSGMLGGSSPRHVVITMVTHVLPTLQDSSSRLPGWLVQATAEVPLCVLRRSSTSGPTVCGHPQRG